MTKLLIVDDNAHNSYLLQALLQGHGYEVMTALDGNEALRTARRDPPDMIITDILMPGMDGFTLCRHWKADDVLKEIPLVFYTATYTDTEDENFALSLGAARFILKPTEPAKLVQIIQEALTAHQANVLTAPHPPVKGETVYYKEYNQALIRKMEDKLEQLQAADQEIARQQEQMQLLHRIDLAIINTLELADLLEQFAREMTAVLHVNRCSIWLLDESGEFLHGQGYGLRLNEPDVSQIQLAVTHPVVAQIFEQKRPLIVPDVYDPAYAHLVDPQYTELFRVQAYLIAPFLKQTEVIGFLVLDDTNGPHIFTPGEIALVQSAATQVVVAIENARLFTAQRQSEARYRGIFEGVRDAILVESLDGKILDVNQAACDMYGWSREELLTKIVPDLVPPDHKALMEDELIGQSSPHPPLETINLRANGELFPVEITAGRQTMGNETVLLVVVRDVTKREQAEEQLRLQSAALEAAANAIMITDYEGVIIWTNPAFTRLTGYTAEEALGQTPRLLKSESQDSAQYQELWQAVLDGQVWQGELVNQRKDGSLYVEEQIITPMLGEQGQISHFISIRQDITARKRAEESLQRYAARLEAVHTIDQAILAAQSPEEVAQVALTQIRQLVPCQQASIVTFDRPRQEATMLAAYGVGWSGVAVGDQRPVSLFEDAEAVRQLGRARLIEDMTAVSPQLPGIKTLLEQGIRSGIAIPLVAKGELIGILNLGAAEPKTFTAEYLEIAQEVADQLALAIQTARLREQTQRHAAELEVRVAERTQELAEANERLTELDKLKSKFVSDVSHELRTPITNLSLYLDLLEHGKPEARGKYTAVLKQEANRLRQMTENILTLSRLELAQTKESKFKLVDLNEIVAQVVIAHHPRAEMSQLRLSFTPSPDLPVIRGEPNQLAQVITNLISNAIRYTPSGAIQVSTYSIPDQGQVCLQVSDTGVGIDAHDLPYLFERFYRGSQTSRSAISGTGLGLAILKEIVDLHDGTIEVESQLGQGSLFRILLPSATS